MSRRAAFGRQSRGRIGSGAPPFLPTQLSGCVLWLRSDLGITLNGSSVSAWADQSGQGNSASQGTGANQPTYISSGGGGGRPYLQFTQGGTQQIGGSLNLSEPLEYFVAARTTSSSPSTTAVLMNWISSGNLVNCTLQVSASLNIEQFNASFANPVTVTVNTDLILDSYFNGASSFLNVNGTTASGSNPGANTGTGYSIGNQGSGASFAWGGFVYEVAAYNRTMLSTERTQVMHYMATLYGVPGL